MELDNTSLLNAPSLYLDWCEDARWQGTILPPDQVEDYLLYEKGVQCEVHRKPDGVMITVYSWQSANLLMQLFKYSHNFVMANPSDSLIYTFYVQHAIKPDMVKRLGQI